MSTSITTTFSEDMTKEQLTRMTRKGQITVPAEIRRALGLNIGDTVMVSLDRKDGGLHANLRPAQSVSDRTFGSVTPRTRPEDLKEHRRLFMEHATERYEKTKRS
jgi:AbrB family looped-hinge helix DNA binding protein